MLGTIESDGKHWVAVAVVGLYYREPGETVVAANRERVLHRMFRGLRSKDALSARYMRPRCVQNREHHHNG